MAGGALEEAKKAVADARLAAEAGGLDPTTGTAKAPPIWFTNNDTFPTSMGVSVPQSWLVGRDTKVVLPQADVLKRVYGMTGDPNAWNSYAQALFDKGALYDMRYAGNVQSVIDATNTAMLMYSNSNPTKPFTDWLADPGTGRIGKTAPDAAQGIDGSLGGTRTDTSTSLNFTDTDTAKGLVDNALSTHLGRAARPDELASFISALKAHEESSPKTTTTTSTSTNAQGANKTINTQGTSDSLGTGGTNASQFADDWAQHQEGSAEYTAATTFMDTFLQAIKAPV